MKKNLQEVYNEWRKAGQEASEGTNITFTWDCGEKSAREDFTNYAELENQITFEDMLQLEKDYKDVIDYEELLPYNEFIDSLTEENYDYAVENYLTIENAYDSYIEGWKISGEENYLTPNEYFEANKETDSWKE